jgi:molybdopterin-guanine dinucleotide biosynthesis protein A
MGRPKATIEIDGMTIAARSAALLVAAVNLAVEVGPGFSTLPTTMEDPPGQGPLAAIVAGRRMLVEQGLSPDASCIVLACDLPLLSQEILEELSAPPRRLSVVPFLDDLAQPLCARWSAADLDEAERRLAAGERSLRDLPDLSLAQVVPQEHWGSDASRLSDADTPDELWALLAHNRPSS